MNAILLSLLAALSPLWQVSFDSLGVNRLVAQSDPYGANLIEGGRLGQVLVTYKVQDGLWQTLPSDRREWDGERTYVDRGLGDAMVLTQTFTDREDGSLHWDILLENRSPFPVYVGDLAVGIPWKGGGDEPDEIFERSFIKHAFVSGDASFFYFTRYSGEAPYVMLLPDKGTPLEYFGTA
jgi:hypothetical protein